MFKFLKKNKIIISAPMSGEVIALDAVPDEAFSSGVLGAGVAIKPSVGRVNAPADAKIDTMFDTKHAVSLVTTDGAEVLIHIGMDTVTLNGKHFTTFKNTGDSVKSKDELIEFDIPAIEAEGLQTVTPIVICNTDDFSEITFTTATQVEAGDDLIYLTH